MTTTINHEYKPFQTAVGHAYRTPMSSTWWVSKPLFHYTLKPHPTTTTSLTYLEVFRLQWNPCRFPFNARGVHRSSTSFYHATYKHHCTTDPWIEHRRFNKRLSSANRNTAHFKCSTKLKKLPTTRYPNNRSILSSRYKWRQPDRRMVPALTSPAHDSLSVDHTSLPRVLTHGASVEVHGFESPPSPAGFRRSFNVQFQRAQKGAHEEEVATVH